MISLDKSKLRIGALIQCTASDLYSSRDPYDYSVGVSRECGLFDEVILAAPNTTDSQIFDHLAPEWNVKLVKGAEFNVSDRMLQAAEFGDVDIVVRLLLRRFYLDTDLVKDMVSMLVREDVDYIRLPPDFNYELGADVFTKKALERTVTLLKGEGQDLASRQFAPWRVMDEDSQNFKTLEHPGSPNYSAPKIAAIKKKLGGLLGENQVHYGWQFPASAYAFVGPRLIPKGTTLDIACGQGSGCRQLVEYNQEVVGVDLDEEFIQRAQDRFADVENLSYVCADAMTYSMPKAYDSIVSLHTLEHLPGPSEFLQRCHENLKPNGTLFLEVPLLLPRPLGEPLYPFHSMEYTRDGLDRACEESGFKVDQMFGRNRGVFTDISSAREAVHYQCSKA